MQRSFTIALDGPVASGKGTIASKIAKKLHGINLNSGGVYRAFALKCIRESVDPDDTSHLQKVLQSTSVSIALEQNNLSDYKIMLDGEDVTKDIITPEVSAMASRYPLNDIYVEHMSKRLAEIADEVAFFGVPIIMEGRNIGTEVIPSADCKIYLTADVKVRAKRRFDQYQKRGVEKTLDEVLIDTKMRDEQDMSRLIAPLPRHPEKLGYTIVDNTDQTQEQTVSAIMQLLKDKNLYGK